MAQFYQVLSQDDKSNESAQFYSNIEDNRTVQYVISPEGHQQQFQTQQVVVSSDQLMVVEGQGEPVILDQSQLAYQTSSYIIQDSSGLDFPNTRQQVYYMANAPPNQHVVVETTLPPQPQPVVLNHQLMANQINKVEPVAPMIPNAPTNQIATVVVPEVQVGQQIRAPVRTQPIRPQMPPKLMQQPNISQKTVAQTTAPSQMQSLLKKGPSETRQIINKDGNQDMVALPDGTLVNLPQYKKLLALQKQTERLLSPGNPNAAQKRQRNPTPRSRKKPAAAARNARVTTENSNEAVAQNAKQEVPQQQPQQFINQNMPTQQQIQQQLNRAQQSPAVQQALPPSHNQYIIQPPRANRPHVQRPLPAFLHSSQIQHIIAENTPMNEEYSDSIRMLVLLDNGEQRLITFTLPKEACTIQEILEQVNVPFQHDTNIQVVEANANGLNYIVTVGKVQGFNLETSNDEISSTQSSIQSNDGLVQIPVEIVEAPKPSPPEPPKELPIKLIEGKLAVCNYCGYLSEDFNKCTRCKRRLPPNVKAIPSVTTSGRKIDPRSLVDRKVTLNKPNGTPKLNLLQRKPRPAKPTKLLECETVVVSSDEEDGDKKTPNKNVSEQLLEKLGASVTISPISKEPSFIDIQKSGILCSTRSPEKFTADKIFSTLLTCRTVRIGSYRFIPPEPVRVDSTGVVIKVPHPRDGTIHAIRIDGSDIVKVLISFQKSLPVLFYYLVPSVGNVVRSTLDMVQGSDCYYDPLSEEEDSHRRITLLPEVISEESKNIIQRIYKTNGNNLLEELTYKEANEILIKTCPKELTKAVLSYGIMSEIKQLLMYPPEGRGRISINTEDYTCLGQDQFLNDVIIDFYLKYLQLNLPKEQQDKVHIFSTFFYKRLTTKPVKASRKSQPTELDPTLTAAEKRHARVKTWTKNVNLFEKDFIVVPINENCHWFLAIICFPGMNGCRTMDGQSVKIEPKQSKKKKNVTTIGNVTVSSVKEARESISCEDSEMSDKDEAEGDESELESDDSEDSPTLSVENDDNRPPIKQPCILIFDSLAGASRSRVVATLRDYLTCEHKAKLNSEKIFTKDVIKGACPKVPQQTNFTDCGLYLLQYVENFFMVPIKDYYIPIQHLKTWFEEITVTKKREDISLLIKSLMKQYGKDMSLLPEVTFPTLNGELVENKPLDHDDNFADPEEEEEEGEMMEEDDDDDEDYCLPPHKNDNSPSESEKIEDEADDNALEAPIKPSSENVKTKRDFLEQPVNTSLLKPDASELPKQSNKDALSYLKAKRIIRHKNNLSDASDAKRMKCSEPIANSS